MKIVVKEREFIMDKFQLEGSFKECVNKINEIINKELLTLNSK